jgi:hypothetical protein
VIVGSTGMFPGRPVRVEIGGEHGTAVSESGLSVFSFRETKPEDEELKATLAPGVAPTGGAGSNVDVALDLHFKNVGAILDAWERGEEAPTSGPEARKAVAIILAMYESAKKGGAAVAVK